MSHPETSPTLFIITGSQGAGKTSLCARLVEAAREAGWKTAGILSNPVFDGSLPAAIDAEDLHSGEIHRLATRSEDPTPGLKHWKIEDAAIHWGNQVFSTSTPVDLLVVDELGPLEFERGSGWQAGITAINSKKYAIAIAVVRAEMLGEALIRWPQANIVEVDTPEDSAYKAQVLAESLF